MCSTSEQRLTEIGRAIDDLAALADVGGPTASDAERSLDDPLLARGHAADCADEVMKRVADLWARLAQLDPEVAKRLPTYEA